MLGVVKLIELCENYLTGKYTIEQFQSRLITASMHDDIERDIQNLFIELDHQLEQIRFSYDEEEQLAVSSTMVAEFLSKVHSRLSDNGNRSEESWRKL